MLDVGIIGLDTSHPGGFAPLIDGHDDMQLSGVWDGLDIRDSEYVASFCEEHGAQRYDEIDAMVDAVDAAMVLTVNWDTHASLAEPFLNAGIATCVDKPLIGSLSDLQALERAAENAPLFGGSAVPFHREIASLPRGGDERTIYGAGYNDYFYYRTHLVDIARALADADWREVRPAPEPGTTVDVRFENGVHTTLRFDGSDEGGVFSLLDIGETTQAIQIRTGKETLARMYRPFIEAFCEAALGKRDDTGRVLNAGELALAAEAALAGEETVTPDSDELQAVSLDGTAFMKDYSPYY